MEPVTTKTDDDVFSVDKNDNKASKSEIDQKGESEIVAHIEGDIAPQVENDLTTPAKSRGSVVSAHDISATLYGTPDDQKNRSLHADETNGGMNVTPCHFYSIPVFPIYIILYSISIGSRYRGRSLMHP